MYVHIFLVILCATPTLTEYPLEFKAQVQSYPDIIRSKDLCLPLKGSYEHAQTFVCDPDRLLTVNQINRLNTFLKELRSYGSQSTSQCDPNNPTPVMAIALVNKLNVGNENPERLLSYASVFAYYLFNEWNLPSKCHQGSDKIMVFFSKDDGVIYTFAGNLLDKKLSSRQIVDIAVQSRLSFSEGIYEGLSYIIRRYRDAIVSGMTKWFDSSRNLYGR